MLTTGVWSVVSSFCRSLLMISMTAMNLRDGSRYLACNPVSSNLLLRLRPGWFYMSFDTKSNFMRLMHFFHFKMTETDLKR